MCVCVCEREREKFLIKYKKRAIKVRRGGMRKESE